MNAKRKYKYTCHFCKEPAPIGSRKYIYPIPAKYKPRPNDGAYACLTCHPTILAEQKADGHMEVVKKVIS
jgi:hypothetical protein